MDKFQQIVQLCLPLLTPEDTCKLRCTSPELQHMRLSWHDNFIDFNLDGSVSGSAWLLKNIVSMQSLSLTTSFNMPQEVLADVMKGGK